MSLKERFVDLSHVSVSKIRPNQNLEIALLMHKKEGVVEDVCRIEYSQAGTLSPSGYILESLKLAVNPILGEENYVSISSGETYCAKQARKHFRVQRMTQEEFNMLNTQYSDLFKQL